MSHLNMVVVMVTVDGTVTVGGEGYYMEGIME